MVARRTHIQITADEAARIGCALLSSDDPVARELAPAFSEVASGELAAIELSVGGSSPDDASRIAIDELSIDMASRSVAVSGKPVQLTPKEFDILAFLASNRGTVFSKEEIYRAVWRDQYLLDDSNIMAFVRKIRKKIEPEPDSPRYLLTVWGGRLQGGRVIRYLAESQESRKNPAMCRVLRLFYSGMVAKRTGGEGFERQS